MSCATKLFILQAKSRPCPAGSGYGSAEDNGHLGTLRDLRRKLTKETT